MFCHDPVVKPGSPVTTTRFTEYFAPRESLAQERSLSMGAPPYPGLSFETYLPFGPRGSTVSGRHSIGTKSLQPLIQVSA